MASQDQGSFPPGTPVTCSGKDEEPSMVRIIMIKKGWWVVFEGDPRRRRQGSPRPLSITCQATGPWDLSMFSALCTGSVFQFWKKSVRDSN